MAMAKKYVSKLVVKLPLFCGANESGRWKRKPVQNGVSEWGPRADRVGHAAAGWARRVLAMARVREWPWPCRSEETSLRRRRR